MNAGEYNRRITLRAITLHEDPEGYQTKAYTDKVVWASEKSVSRSEFYSANANGIDVSIVFEIRAENWENQDEVKYRGKEYRIVRSYQKGTRSVELVCSDKAV